MRTSDLCFDLPDELIAQQPCEPRDTSRLLVLERQRGTLTHTRFRQIGDWLTPGDLLVRNDTRVIPARFECRRPTGGAVTGLFLRCDDQSWEVLLKPSRRLQVGETLAINGCDVQLKLLTRGQRGNWRAVPVPACEPVALLERVGQPPLPPYIRRPEPRAEDRDRYQTVYANAPGAVAAPTAGLHFTPELLDGLRMAGVNTCDVTLHVGLGTFAPVTVTDLAEHAMHSEWFRCDASACACLRETRARGHRIVAVGTTAARVLESLPDASAPREGWTDILIYPPYRFRHVDALLTNFHLPGSTLLAMVMALAGIDPIRNAYREAIRLQYRFYSYGDAMLIV